LQGVLNGDGDKDRVFTRITKVLIMASRARQEFLNGDPETKRQIVTAIGSNLTLKAQKLNIDVKIPFWLVAGSLISLDSLLGPFEPEN